ncbi:SRPBCC domain-containing protein [Urbifossiella limnaea]|uniref:Carbon monoxide dehydrogenase subunit G (CoxG) n=1 Tax=Urbifossiella limnaea TaxID=2528023 RepID=A0A517XLQ4_9BACT|nr:SRPBCC domain-containing protein [Urbifossiella limnaea]QDU18438.1 Carbon monoxide dehydrogenase subunit G (CoxG) [Urbifossiella limnaea]
MIAFAGDRQFPQPVSAVAEALADVAWLVATLPDVQVTTAAPDHAAWRMKPKLAFMAGHLDTTMHRTEHRHGEVVGFRVVTKAVGATSTVTIRLAFHDADGGTRVAWTGELAEVTGLLKMVPKGLLQATAEKVIGDVWVAVAARLG